MEKREFYFLLFLLLGLRLINSITITTKNYVHVIGLRIYDYRENDKVIHNSLKWQLLQTFLRSGTWQKLPTLKYIQKCISTFET